MSDCLFCKIVRGELPSFKVHEDDFSFAFLDINPVNLGHVLVVPKEHHDDVAAMPEADAARLFAVVHKVGRSAPRALGAPAFNIGVNTGAAAGQKVMHAHVHVIPRFEDDGLQMWHAREVSKDELQTAAGKIAAALNA